MRLKVRPEDFRVREELDFARVPDGRFYVHLVRKEKLSTHEALARIAKIAGVPRADLAFAGLKDRQGRTEQWITIRGRRVDYRDRSLQVMFRGRTDKPINSRMSAGNHFEIVVRSLDRAAIALLRARAAAVSLEGLPNYFDDQRFGCLQHGQGFAMRDVLAGRYEEALKRLIATPSPKALGGDVKLKQLLARRWGDWETCAAIARGPLYRPSLSRLVAEPEDFRGAIERLPTRMKLIAAFSYQSWLWNRAVDRMLHRMLSPGRRIVLPTLVGQLAAWDEPAPGALRRLEQLRTPLFGPTPPDAADPAFRESAQTILVRDGVRGGVGAPLPGMDLREEHRDLVVRPRGLEISDAERDELDRSRSKVVLSFGLPRGSYATLVVKRLTVAERPRRAPARSQAR
ncbi:MAG: tRNA pseudouridine(13) synthase TruD [Planctomycetota bacterium]